MNTSKDKTPKSMLIQVGWEQGKVLNRNGHGGLDEMNWVFHNNVNDKLTFDW